MPPILRCHICPPKKPHQAHSNEKGVKVTKIASKIVFSTTKNLKQTGPSLGKKRKWRGILYERTLDFALFSLLFLFFFLIFSVWISMSANIDTHKAPTRSQNTKNTLRIFKITPLISQLKKFQNSSSPFATLSLSVFSLSSPVEPHSSLSIF